MSDYVSTPVLFLSVTFLVMCFASYKVGCLSSTMAPYACFLTGVTLIIVESTGLTHPDEEWLVALSRTEETFVGISAVLIITPLFRLRRPRVEFKQLAGSALNQLKDLTNAELRHLREGTRSRSELVQEQTAWLTVAVLERLQLTRYVGNVSLFFIALAVLLAGLTDWLVNL